MTEAFKINAVNSQFVQDKLLQLNLPAQKGYFISS